MSAKTPLTAEKISSAGFDNPDLKKIIKIAIAIIVGGMLISTVIAVLVGYVIINYIIRPGVERLPDITNRGRELIQQINPELEQRLTEDEAKIRQLEEQVKQLQEGIRSN